MSSRDVKNNNKTKNSHCYCITVVLTTRNNKRQSDWLVESITEVIVSPNCNSKLQICCNNFYSPFIPFLINNDGSIRPTTQKQHTVTHQKLYVYNSLMLFFLLPCGSFFCFNYYLNLIWQ